MQRRKHYNQTKRMMYYMHNNSNEYDSWEFSHMRLIANANETERTYNSAE